MRILSKSTLRDFWLIRGEAEVPLRVWHRKMKHGHYRTLQDVTEAFPRSSAIGNNRVVFRIHGNHFRLVVQFNFAYSIAFIRFIGTHHEYDKISAAAV